MLFWKANRDLWDASQPAQVVSRYSSFPPQPKTCILDRLESLTCAKLSVIGVCPLIDERPFRGVLLPLAWWLLGQAPASPVTPIRGLTENGWIDRLCESGELKKSRSDKVRWGSKWMFFDYVSLFSFYWFRLLCLVFERNWSLCLFLWTINNADSFQISRAETAP